MIQIGRLLPSRQNTSIGKNKEADRSFGLSEELKERDSSTT
jgi:hypothetical protein